MERWLGAVGSHGQDEVLTVAGSIVVEAAVAKDLQMN